MSDFPPGYDGGTQGTLPSGNDILQLSQFGTYTVVLKSLTSIQDDFLNTRILCDNRDTFTIVVDDIPKIDAGSDATICDDNIQLNGSTPRNAAGIPVDINILWETVENYPGVVISDVTIRNPVVTGLVTGQSYTFRYSFPGDPNCEKEDLVTITVKEECDDTPPLTCDISLSTRCHACGCSKPVFSVNVRDSNGDKFEFGTFQLTWLLDGVPTQIGLNSDDIVTHYEGPLVVTAQITFMLENGEECTIEESIAVTCGDDCPVVGFEYSTDDCFKDMFYGEVTIVDGAGHPLSEASIEWDNNGILDENPYMVFSQPGEVVPVHINFYWRKGCSFKMDFEPDCFKGNGGSKRATANASDDDPTHPEATGVYPNPASRHEAVTVDFGKYKPASLRVLDLNGREIFQTSVTADAKNYRLSSSTLPAGVLIAVLRDEAGNSLSLQRFVVR
ncbi:T9SS type A sorting domain-containing protein [Neolewinella persica]|uniref:T9SS type A sorting domain-containing protein n=1 Tax=Neolewinella persica TaxID=70998 RepID=UPI0003733EFF|nr:T9SS type A sorting domain-containing protein [Neolewinella persica]